MVRSEKPSSPHILEQLRQLHSELNVTLQHQDIHDDPLYLSLQDKIKVMQRQEWRHYSLAIENITKEIQADIGDDHFGEDKNDYDVLPLFFQVGRDDVAQKILNTYGVSLTAAEYSYYKKISVDLRWQQRIDAEYVQRSYDHLLSIQKKLEVIKQKLIVNPSWLDYWHGKLEKIDHSISRSLGIYYVEMQVIANFAQGQPLDRRPKSVSEMDRLYKHAQQDLNDLINAITGWLRNGDIQYVAVGQPLSGRSFPPGIVPPTMHNPAPQN